MTTTSEPFATAEHHHIYLGQNHERNERRVWMVIALTTVMMVAEIVAGHWFGSMALTADGWHMSTHAGAMLISALAYLYARREARNPRFSFGTGKFGDLAGFASAVVLAVVALLIAVESGLRLISPVEIDFNQAILVAVIGLVVNLVSAVLLKDDHHHDHGHGHGSHAHHGHGSHAHHDHGSHAEQGAKGGRDNNLRAAYLHVLADALTSVLAIVALLLGKWNGWNFLDPLMGIVGGLVIARWSWGLIRSTATTLVDAVPLADDLPQEIRESVETEEDRITDLHVWQVGPGHHAAIVAIHSRAPKAPAFYKQKLAAIHELSHVTVEVSPARA
ncbi:MULTISPECIES: CDF family Co(II)/Ni(II) efflux transporter DmeF [Agrobacterium]|uniref:CDF family Co(II)/Ni(II) efflux transporter DmeF n=1 Tax=Agrobacterium TaxID=357 RepID=UPI0022B84A60|nr:MULTISPECIES: CDF family Co(II)/Ni(II) efflux transporter DmeF [Agrobacterium]MCZ7854493.1 CDF family Co(II)/Ni(II) efflux transporter DmeF [Agrobacterium salinitolerans]MCZ7887490.1 CDF family Co(II)/Ni(II) efflux transporter DmeF [Agrobacterium salinitolerans]MCZ7975284.1 CDF family Co(II)/Ni(II) efflux transporter DmeF [Agrobacterium salinitolerans]MDA5630086.1 CDF family Co(II)/Ni(II) efflux transporter DmeF [Agrobacterium sp. ST15.16.055]MDA6981030.1 CDF family Co(II)/Ni(II) efflux tra